MHSKFPTQVSNTPQHNIQRTYFINANRTMLWCTYHPLYNIVYNAGSKSSEQFSRCCSSQEMTLSDKQRWTTPCQKLTHMDWHWPPKRFLSVSWCHLELTRCQIYEVKLLWCYWMADWLTGLVFFSYKVYIIMEVQNLQTAKLF